jgi:tRNA dimethylallyltransferase
MRPSAAVIVIGPTASGKSALAHKLCDHFRTKGFLASALVNLDAFQFYRGLDIGTAKPTREEIEKYDYHCVDILNPEDRIDAQEYARLAGVACENILGQGGVPVCVGGSGLYLRAFLHGLDKLPEADEGLRHFLRLRAKKTGWPDMHRWLQAIDAARAMEIHPNDSVRIERALEIFFLTGKPPSESYRKSAVLQKQPCLFNAFVVHVDAPDAVLRSRIEARTPVMLAAGWVSEVTRLFKQYGDSLSSFQSMKAIGYREILSHLQRPTETEEILGVNIAVKTWQYAKRQRTWNAKEVSHANYVAGESTESLTSALESWWNANAG